MLEVDQFLDLILKHFFFTLDLLVAKEESRHCKTIPMFFNRNRDIFFVQKFKNAFKKFTMAIHMEEA